MLKEAWLKSWPLNEGERGIWHWIQTPFRDATKNQWRLVAVFEGQDGRHHEANLPWGILPWMLLGYPFVDGKQVNGARVGSELEIVLGDTTDLAIQKGSYAISRELYRLGGPRNCEEPCFVLCPATVRGGQTVSVVIPVAEAVRALFAPTKMMAQAMFQPNYWERVLVEQVVEGDCLHLEFTDEVPIKSLTWNQVVHIARILKDESFGATWDEIYANVAGPAASGTEPAAPMITRLPALNPHWRVRGLLRGDRLLVLEILYVEAASPLPFDRIEYSHPGLEKAERIEGKDEHRTGREKTPSDHPIDSTPTPPVDQGDPVLIRGARFGLLNRQRLKVEAKGHTVRKYVRGSGSPTVVKQRPGGTGEPISLSDEGARGRHRAGEFVPTPAPPIEVDASSGLGKFARAVDELKDLCTDGTITWTVAPMTGDKPFANLGTSVRLYAVVRIEWPEEQRCWLIEFGRSDSPAMATILFSIGPDGLDAPERAISALVSQGVGPRGSWIHSKVDSIADQYHLKVDYAKHTDSPALQWARRLLDKARSLANVPAPDPA